MKQEDCMEEEKQDCEGDSECVVIFLYILLMRNVCVLLSSCLFDPAYLWKIVCVSRMCVFLMHSVVGKNGL